MTFWHSAARVLASLRSGVDSGATDTFLPLLTEGFFVGVFWPCWRGAFAALSFSSFPTPPVSAAVRTRCFPCSGFPAPLCGVSLPHCLPACQGPPACVCACLCAWLPGCLPGCLPACRPAALFYKCPDDSPFSPENARKPLTQGLCRGVVADPPFTVFVSCCETRFAALRKVFRSNPGKQSIISAGVKS